jgi:hypothetical protein
MSNNLNKENVPVEQEPKPVPAGPYHVVSAAVQPRLNPDGSLKAVNPAQLPSPDTGVQTPVTPQPQQPQPEPPAPAQQ